MGCPKCESELVARLERDPKTKQVVSWEVSCTKCDWKDKGTDDINQHLKSPLGAPDRKEPASLEYYSRITGYYQKLSGWNPGKEQEWQDRHRYKSDELKDAK